MKESKSAQLMKNMRKGIGKTQQQLAIKMFQSREYISKQESGERKIPPVTTKYFIEKYNNPFLALEAINEYLGWNIKDLDGPAAIDLKNCAPEKLNEQLKIVLEVLTRVQKGTNSWHEQEIQTLTKELAKVIHFSIWYLATLSDSTNIEWKRIWEDHHTEMKAKGYVR